MSLSKHERIFIQPTKDFRLIDRLMQFNVAVSTPVVMPVIRMYFYEIGKHEPTFRHHLHTPLDRGLRFMNLAQ